MFALNLAIFLLGWLVSYPLTNSLGPWITVAFAPVVGWLLSGVFVLGAVWAGVGISALALGLACLSVAVVLWAALRVDPPRPAEMLPFAIGVGCCLLVCVLAEFIDFHILVPDAITFVLLGRWVAEAGYVEPAVAPGFLDYGSLPIAWQGLAYAAKVEYLYALGPTLAASLLAAMCALGNRLWASSSANSETRQTAMFLAVGVLATTPLFWIHTQTIHSILPSALFILWFWGGSLLYLQERHSQWLVIAFLSIFGFTLCRVEGPLYAAVFLSIFYSDERVPTKLFSRGLHPYATAVFLYYGLLIGHYEAHFDAILRPVTAAGLLAPLGALFVFSICASLKPFYFISIRKNLSLICLASMSAALLFFMAKRPGHYTNAILWTCFNIVETGAWGFTWIGLGVALVWMRKAHAPSWESMLWKALAAFILLVFLLVEFRLPYRPSPWDTANRLLLLATPMVLLIVLGRWVGLANTPKRG